MAEKILMPQLGESVVEGTIAEWFVSAGDKVDVGTPLVEVETDKANTEVPATKAGYVKAILVEAGVTVEVGEPIIELVTDESELESGAAESGGQKSQKSSKSQGDSDGDAEDSKEGDSKKVAASKKGDGPKKEKSAHKVNTGRSPWNRGGGVAGPMDGKMVEGLALASGGGKGGASDSGDTKAPQNQQTSSAPSRDTSLPYGAPVGAKYYRAPKVRANPEDTVTKFSKRRGIISEHMVYSKHVSPHVPCFAEVDMTKVVAMRREHKQEFKDRGISLTVFSFVLKATTEALREFPGVNAVIGDAEIIQRGKINLGFAVETDGGLLVPVIKNADSLSVSGLAKGVVDMAAKARDKKITIDDLSGGTFTVSNPGRKGNLIGAAVINQPQAGILRMGEIVRRPVVREIDGEEVICIRSIMMLSLSYDHRLIDGVEGNGFLYRVGELLEAANFQL